MKICIICKKQFRRPSKETKEYYQKRKFCSYKCYWESKKGTIPWNAGMVGYAKKYGVGFQKGNQLWKRKIPHRKAEYIHKGYRYIYSPNHPFKNKQKYVKEHRLVMEKHLGRYLTKIEVVHHINHNKLDNKIENLKLYPTNKIHMETDHRLKSKTLRV